MQDSKLEIFRSEMLGLRAKSEATVRSYLSKIRLLIEFAGKKSEEVSVFDIEKMIIKLRDDKLAINTIRQYQTAFRVFFKWLAVKYRVVNQAEDLRVYQEENVNPVIPTIEEVKALIVQNRRLDELELRNVAIVIMLAETGIRESELVQLRNENIEMQNQQFLLNLSVHTKRHQQRLIPFCFLKEGSLVSELWAAYYFQFVLGKKKDDFLFQKLDFYVDKNGERHKKREWENKKISAKTIYTIITKLRDKAGIEKKITPHSLRHFAATNWALNKIDIKRIQYLLGHRDIGSTMKYIHYAESYKEDSAKQNAMLDTKIEGIKNISFVKDLKKLKESL